MTFHSRGRGFFRGCMCCTQSEPAQAIAVPVNRRNFLAGGTALGIAAPSLITRRAFAQTAPATRQRIDVHHHYLPPFQLDAVMETRAGAKPPDWSVQKSLDDMDKAGTATAIVSIIQPGVWLGDVEKSRRLARDCNEYGAKLVSDHPGRFRFWAAIPLPDAEGSLREIEYSLDTLKAEGIVLMTSFGNKYLGDPSFEPVYAELNRRKAVVYTHPLTPNCCGNDLVPGIPPGTIEYATDTTRTIASLLFSGTAAKFPDIRFIFSHSGGTLPFLTGRFVRQAKTGNYPFMPNGPLPELQKFHYEIAQGNTPGQLAALMKLAPLAQLMFGSDYPFRPGTEAVEGLANYGFGAGELQAIDRDNALRLLPQLKT